MRSLERAKSHEDVRRGGTKAVRSSSVVFTSAFSLSLVLDHGNFNLIGNQVGAPLRALSMPNHCTVIGILSQMRLLKNSHKNV